MAKKRKKAKAKKAKKAKKAVKRAAPARKKKAVKAKARPSPCFCPQSWRKTLRKIPPPPLSRKCYKNVA